MTKNKEGTPGTLLSWSRRTECINYLSFDITYRLQSSYVAILFFFFFLLNET